MESCQRWLEFVLFFHKEARLPVFILSHSFSSIPLLFLVYSLFVCVCMCEDVVPVDVTLMEINRTIGICSSMDVERMQL